MKNNDKKLVLFDIDGTLIHPGNGAKRALTKAIFKNFGIKIKVTYENTAGKTDRWIIKDILLESGIEQNLIDEKMGKIIDDYLTFIKEEYNKDNDAKVFESVFELLEKLSKIENVYLGLLTGNIEHGARIKLSPFNLNRFFPFGAFGSDGMYRDDLPGIALKRAKHLYGVSFYGKNLVIIGDTVNDVTCGKKFNAKSIAVVRRPEYLEKVKKAKPDFLFTGFEEIDKVIGAILL